MEREIKIGKALVLLQLCLRALEGLAVQARSMSCVVLSPRRTGTGKKWTEHLAYLSKTRALCCQHFVLLTLAEGRVSVTLSKCTARIWFSLV